MAGRLGEQPPYETGTSMQGHEGMMPSGQQLRFFIQGNRPPTPPIAVGAVT